MSHIDLVHFRVRRDKHCWRVTVTHAGTSITLAYSVAVNASLDRALRWDIIHHARLLRSGRHGFREYKYPHPRPRS